MPVFKDINSPTEAQRLSYYGWKVQQCIDEYNAALPVKLGAEWKARLKAFLVQRSLAESDAREHNYKDKLPPWEYSKDNINDDGIIYHSALERDEKGELTNEGQVHSYLLAHEKYLPSPSIPPSLPYWFLLALEKAAKDCGQGVYWDAS